MPLPCAPLPPLPQLLLAAGRAGAQLDASLALLKCTAQPGLDLEYFYDHVDMDELIGMDTASQVQEEIDMAAYEARLEAAADPRKFGTYRKLRLLQVKVRGVHGNCGGIGMRHTAGGAPPCSGNRACPALLVCLRMPLPAVHIPCSAHCRRHVALLATCSCRPPSLSP